MLSSGGGDVNEPYAGCADFIHRHGGRDSIAKFILLAAPVGVR